MPKIRQAEFADYEKIITLKKKYDFAIKSFEEWENRWRHNPAMSGNWTMGWVLEDNNKKIVGYLGNIPMDYICGNKKLLAAAMSDFVVDKEFRNYSIMLLKKYFTQEIPDFFITTTASHDGEKVYAAFKAERIPVHATDVALFWIINHKQFSKSICRKKNLPYPNYLYFPFYFAFMLLDIINGHICLPHKGTSEVQVVHEFDYRFDEFWTAYRNKYNSRLLFVRDRMHLDWHFKQAGKRKNLWIFIIEHDRKIQSYAIFLRQTAEKIGLERVRLIDYCSLKNEQSSFQKIITAAISLFRESGLHMIESIGFNESTRSAIEQSNPHKRSLLSWPFYYKSNRRELDNLLSDPNKWNPNYIDGDSSV